MESRATVLGYVQRGGTPSPMDRVLSTRFGHQAAELIAGARFGNMVALREGRIAEVPIRDIAGRDKKVPDDHPLIAAARAVGTCFGD